SRKPLSEAAFRASVETMKLGGFSGFSIAAVISSPEPLLHVVGHRCSDELGRRVPAAHVKSLRCAILHECGLRPLLAANCQHALVLLILEARMHVRKE